MPRYLKTSHERTFFPITAKTRNACLQRLLDGGLPRGGPHLLHVAQHVLPAVEHALALLGVQLVDEVRGVVLAAALVPATRADAGQGAGGASAGPGPSRLHVFFRNASGFIKEMAW